MANHNNTQPWCWWGDDWAHLSDIREAVEDIEGNIEAVKQYLADEGEMSESANLEDDWGNPTPLH